MSLLTLSIRLAAFVPQRELLMRDEGTQSIHAICFHYNDSVMFVLTLLPIAMVKVLFLLICLDGRQH